ncbi:leukocyte elastase inhibitor-like [Penaeus monodon]|uniref:leukocyte elastase inhibitor-like n=1 Tax=Penaeus monodon TaxID=6687 RepID=UPI0018A6F7E1|nr:leukocyte elastase inhibitor-like [Penaeus monodon]
MKLLLVAALLGLAVRVSPQCISQFDDMIPPNFADLSYILPFSLRLFKELVPHSGNFLISPYSIWNALVMAYLGTNGETKTQMEKVLQLSNKVETLALYRSLSQHIKHHGSYDSPVNYIFDITNGVCVHDRNILKDCVARLLTRELQTVNFQKSEGSAVTINQFINKTSRGNIPHLVYPFDLNQGEMMMINAVYFRGLWHKRFAADRTRLERFYSTRQKQYFVDMMSQEGEFKTGISEELEAQVLEMPFKGKRASMYVFLPQDQNNGRELDNMLKRMNPGSLLSAMRILDRRDVVINFPKFKYEKCLGSELRLALIRMGIRELFTESADLTTFFPAGGLMVKDDIHRARIEINEDGDDATKTKWSFGPLSVPPAPKPFNCNRPFLFLVMDSYNTNILFMGVFRHP